MKSDYGYIYYVRNEINGMLYIGKITANKLDYEKNYRGSGVKLQEAIKKYGKDKFSIHFLAAACDGEELTWLEKYYLKYYCIPNPLFYNVNQATSNSQQSEYFNMNNKAGVNLKTIVCYNYKTKETKTFDNITQFCQNNGFVRGCVFNVISGQRVSHKDCIFWYKDNPISSDALNWIINYKTKTHYKTRYFKIEEVKEELNKKYKEMSNKTREYEFHGYYIESGQEIDVPWEKLKQCYLHDSLSREGKAPLPEIEVETIQLNTEYDNKFEQERDCEYILFNDEKTLYFNYDEIRALTQIYSDVDARLLRQAIRRGQKTVMNEKYCLKTGAYREQFLYESH